MLFMGDRVVNKKGIKGTIVPIPHDYSFADPNDPFKMARLVFVKFDDEDEGILIPESRLEKEIR
jgi:hypothetical protein